MCHWPMDGDQILCKCCNHVAVCYRKCIEHVTSNWVVPRWKVPCPRLRFLSLSCRGCRGSFPGMWQCMWQSLTFLDYPSKVNGHPHNHSTGLFLSDEFNGDWSKLVKWPIPHAFNISLLNYFDQKTTFDLIRPTLTTNFRSLTAGSMLILWKYTQQYWSKS